MLTVKKGTYKSETKGSCEAVLIELNGESLCIADLSGCLYTSYGKGSFTEILKEESSIIFPKVTDFFSQELLELTVKFKG
jgi:hypothetical protein